MKKFEEEQHCKQVPLEELIDNWDGNEERANDLQRLYVFLHHTHYELRAYKDNFTGEYFWASNLNPSRKK